MPEAIPLLSDMLVDTDEPDAVETGDNDITIKLDDGSVVVDLRPKAPDEKNSQFDRNLADDLSVVDRGVLAQQLMEGIDADLQSRSEWEATRTRGIDLLGFKLEEPRSDVGSQGASLEGLSTVRDSTLAEAVLRFQANASGELLPAEGPVKIKNVGPETGPADQLAEAFQKDFNHYLTDIATEYYPDTKRMLFWTGFGGSGWKKIYSCPIRRRPVSESVDANDLIISYTATDLWNASRVTHRITMRPSTMKRMQLLGVYRDVGLGQPQADPSRVQEKKDSVEGVRSSNQRPEDQPYTLYECYCELDLDQFAPRQFKGKAIPLPYRVTIDKDSKEILEVHRNWKQDDVACLPRKYFVRYPYIEGMGIYGLGLVHVLGNSASALTAAERLMLDNGMYANFPGFAVAKSATKQLTNEMRPPPGGGVAIDTNGMKLGDAVMPLPYKDITAGLLGLWDKIKESAQRLGGTADIPVGEGKQDAPVGTTLALIEQATKVESAVHKGLFTAQSEEFQLLRERFEEDPEAFWRHRPESENTWTEQTFLEALKTVELVPVADPNVPSHIHRIAKAVALNEIDLSNPGVIDKREKVKRLLSILKIDDMDSLVPPPSDAPPPPDPNLITATAKMITAQTAAKKADAGVASDQAKIANAAAQRQSDENIATVDLAKELVIHNADRADAQRKAQSDMVGHALQANQQQHDQRMDLAGHSLDAMKAAHAANMDVAGAVLDHGQAAHDQDLAQRQHNLEIHRVLNPPKPQK